MTRFHPATRRRTAFTLVEMLVAAALIIFMMWIISSAFQKGLEAFSTLKTAGDMQEKLRGAATVIRRDLTRPHFASENALKGEDLGDQRIDDVNWTPPTEGYFRIFQAGNRVADGLDPDDPGAVHFRVADAAAQGDVLQFTIKQRGARRDQTFSVDLKDPGQDINPTEAPPETPLWGRLHRFSYPTNARHVKSAFLYPSVIGMGGGYNPASDPGFMRTQFTTTWAEVTYFLRPNGETTGTQQRFNLYRRQNLLVTDFNEQNGFGENVHFVPGPDRPLDVPLNDPRYSEISSWPQSATVGRVNSQKMITAPIRRFGVNPASPAGVYQSPIPPLPDNSTDLLLTDVIDFEVKVLWEPNTLLGGPKLTDTEITLNFNNPDFPFDRLPQCPLPPSSTPWGGQRIFDTWSQRNTAGQPDDYVGSAATPLWNSGPTTSGYGGGSFGPQSIPLKIRVRGVQIEMRVWDQKSQTTRQITIIQDL